MGARMAGSRVGTWLLLVLIILSIFPQGIFAHAMLEQASPAPDSLLKSSPTAITLTFNERLERELFYIKVFDSQGQSVTETPTEMSQDQKELVLPLPALEDDIYTVTYNVISADGHPIRGSYVITVGSPTPADIGDQLSRGDGQKDAEIQIGTFGIRILYFLALLLITGWIAWGAVFSFQKLELTSNYLTWTRYLQTFYLVALLAMSVVQSNELLTSWSMEGIRTLLFGTYTGISLAISLILSLVGFLILQRNAWVDGIWVTLLLLAKCLSGHAMAFDPPFWTILLDFVHLLASSLWAGGLFYTLLFWKSHQEQVLRFLPLFSKTALASIVVLTITGTWSTWIFLPKWSYLVETSWGLLLLGKVALVGLVIMVGAVLRQRLKKKSMDRISTWLKVDIAVMIFIVGIVGVFTYLSPHPTNQPLNWVEHDESVDMTAQITPNAPGMNHFNVQASLPNPTVEVKQLELFLVYQDDPDIAPIKVPLTAEPRQTDVYHFYCDGPYLPLAGNWTMEVRVMDSEDNETVYTTDFTIY